MLPSVRLPGNHIQVLKSQGSWEPTSDFHVSGPQFLETSNPNERIYVGSGARGAGCGPEKLGQDKNIRAVGVRFAGCRGVAEEEEDDDRRFGAEWSVAPRDRQRTDHGYVKKI